MSVGNIPIHIVISYAYVSLDLTHSFLWKINDNANFIMYCN